MTENTELIKNIIKGGVDVVLSGSTTDNTERKLVTVDPKGKRVVLRHLKLYSAATGNLVIRTYITFPNGTVKCLTDFTKTIPTTETQDALMGKPLIVDSLTYITYQNAVNENAAYYGKLEWAPLEDNAPTQIDSSYSKP